MDENSHKQFEDHVCYLEDVKNKSISNKIITIDI